MLIGRAYLWGLAAGGQTGVANVLDVLRTGIDSTLLALGVRSVRDLRPDDVVVPPGFARVLGAGEAVDPEPLRRRTTRVPPRAIAADGTVG